MPQLSSKQWSLQELVTTHTQLGNTKKFYVLVPPSLCSDSINDVRVWHPSLQPGGSCCASTVAFPLSMGLHAGGQVLLPLLPLLQACCSPRAGVVCRSHSLHQQGGTRHCAGARHEGLTLPGEKKRGVCERQHLYASAAEAAALCNCPTESAGTGRTARMRQVAPQSNSWAAGA